MCVELGDFLGEMMDELGGGDYIEEFVSADLKNQTAANKTECKQTNFSI